MSIDCRPAQVTFRADSASSCPFTKGSDDSPFYDTSLQATETSTDFLLFSPLSLSNLQPSFGNQGCFLVFIAKVHQRKYFNFHFSSNAILSHSHLPLNIKAALRLSHCYGKTSSSSWKKSESNFCRLTLQLFFSVANITFFCSLSFCF